MFGLNGRSFFGSLVGHYFVHFQKDPKKVEKRVDLKKTLEVVGKCGADILGICEISEDQEKELCKGLRKLGYKYFYFGKGHKFKYSGKHVIELVASKFKCKQLNYKIWPLVNRLGGGGGFVVCKFKDVNVFHVHLALPRRGFFEEQIKYMQKILREIKGKIIVMGDFNCCWKDIEKYFPGFKLVSKEMKTCSLTPIMKWFYNKDVDHVFVRGFKLEKVGILDGRSDHKLIYVDLRKI